MRARYYDPATGRFESEDSAKDGANWSLYAHGDPVNMVDPDGMSPEDESAAQLGEYLKMMSKAYSTVATGYMVAGAWDTNRGRALTTEGMAENSPAAASAGFFQEAMGGAEMRGGIKLQIAALLLNWVGNSAQGLGGDFWDLSNSFVQTIVGLL